MQTITKKPKFNYSKVCLSLLGRLPDRQKEVLSNRFGLEGQESETLQEIGNSFGITRERVRQIEKEALNHLTVYQQEKALQDIFAYLAEYLNEHGGVKREDLILSDLGENDNRNYIYFLMILGDAFHRVNENDQVYAFWSLDPSAIDKVVAILHKVQSVFEKEQKPLCSENVYALAEGEPLIFFNSSLEIAKAIERGPLGYFGLVDWPEIRPRGVRDMAYLALCKKGSPIHFRQIAEVANSLDRPSDKKVLPQTLHNELIRDERFVLVGRGIYALKDWGYSMGTVREIIAQLVNQSPSGLTKDEIIKGVLGQRLVKDNTILLNLHNKKHFLRNADGRYILRRKNS